MAPFMSDIPAIPAPHKMEHIKGSTFCCESKFGKIITNLLKFLAGIISLEDISSEMSM